MRPDAFRGQRATDPDLREGFWKDSRSTWEDCGHSGMTDILQSLPDFDTSQFSHILPSLDKHQVTLSDLLTLDAVDIARRAQVPSDEVRRLTDCALQHLQSQLGFDKTAEKRETNGISVHIDWETLTTLDDELDQALGGGIPTRYLTEIVGESGAGKTQCLLTLLLSVQLPVEHGGLSSRAMYISTESALSTSRLAQMLKANPRLAALPDDQKPSLSKILTMQTPDLESQDHILRFQVPVAVKRHGVRLIVIDSIAANYRAELERQGGSTRPAGMGTDGRTSGGKALAARRAQLIQLGSLLRDLARDQNLAIVVANQVADRFTGADALHPAGASGDSSASQMDGAASQHSNRALFPGSSTAPAAPPRPPWLDDPLTLDHQQRFFTGWGDIPLPPSQLKTPSLGLAWANQIAARIALTRDPGSGSGGWSHAAGMKGRRWMRVVFSAWCAPTEAKGVQFEVWSGGVRSKLQSDDEAEGIGAPGVENGTKRIKLDDLDDGSG